MENLILIAPPLAGKGTISKILENMYGYRCISTGVLLRREIKINGKYRKRIEQKQLNGELIDDEIVNELFEQELKKNTRHFILDGYPRNINQAKHLDELLNQLDIEINKVILLDISYDLAHKRLLGRCSCPKCKKVYNTESDELKPKFENLCDECKLPLEKRLDDNEETLKKRYDNYETITKKVISYYEEKQKLYWVDSSISTSKTIEQIKEILGEIHD